MVDASAGSILGLSRQCYSYNVLTGFLTIASARLLYIVNSVPDSLHDFNIIRRTNLS